MMKSVALAFAALAACLAPARATMGEFADCVSAFKAAKASAASNELMCARALPTFLTCHRMALETMSETEKTIAATMMNAEQSVLDCPDAELMLDPKVTTFNQHMRFDVGENKDVRFRRAALETVSVFELKTKLDALVAGFDQTIANYKAELSTNMASFVSEASLASQVGLLKDLITGHDDKHALKTDLEAAKAETATKANRDYVDTSVRANRDYVDTNLASLVRTTALNAQVSALKETIATSTKAAIDETTKQVDVIRAAMTTQLAAAAAAADKLSADLSNKTATEIAGMKAGLAAALAGFDANFKGMNAAMAQKEAYFTSNVTALSRQITDALSGLETCLSRGGVLASDGSCTPNDNAFHAGATCNKAYDGAIRATKYVAATCDTCSATASRLEHCAFDQREKKYTWIPFHDVDNKVYSCHDVQRANPRAPSGVYMLTRDENVHDRTITQPREQFKVYCEFNADGAMTLVESISSSQYYNSPYDWNGKTGGHNPDELADSWRTSPNRAARLTDAQQNSIFKHSTGQVRIRYANNQNGHYLTDVYGVPEADKHILDSACSDKKMFNIAKAYRGASRGGGSSMGFCFNDGQYRTTSNCICGDRHDTTMSYNRCPNQVNNWRRYNSDRSKNLFCSGMHTKCYSVGSHYALGDSYNCNAGGQRPVHGHMWFYYSGNRGGPCSNYGGYGCYGSRWIF